MGIRVVRWCLSGDECVGGSVFAEELSDLGWGR